MSPLIEIPENKISYESNKFVINGKVTQYSSIFIKKNIFNYKVEILSFIRDFRADKLKCLVVINENFRIYQDLNVLSIQLMTTKHNVSQLYKIYFSLNLINDRDLNKLYVSLIDVRDHDIKKLDLRHVLLQKPDILQAQNRKTKKIINCVHTIFGLDSSKKSKLIDWLYFVKKIGYSKVVLYFLDNPKDFLVLLIEKFGSFIQIIDHKLNEKEICRWHYDNVEKFPNDEKFKSLLESCLFSFKTNFEMEDSLIKNTHERLNSNDCLMKNYNEYQYISNYDFDEFIFPRLLDTDAIGTIEKSTSCEKWKSINLTNIDDYLEKLENIFGKNVAYFQFENINMLSGHVIIREKIKLNETVLNYSSASLNLKFLISDSYDMSLFESFRKSIPLFDCINKTIFGIKNLDAKWNNYIGALVNNRAGKSIYNTDFTLSYNQHFAWKIKSSSRMVRVPLKMGYVSHFREQDLNFKKEYSMRNLFFDYEYYNFLFNFE